MHTQLLDLDEHATLWPELTILSRHVEGLEDITVGRHPALGLCVVSHYAFDELVTWATREPIPDELTDGDNTSKAAPYVPATLSEILFDAFRLAAPRTRPRG